MADRIVRSLRNIDSVDKLNDNLVEANDLITTKDDNIYIKRDEDYYKLTFKDELLEKINTNMNEISKNKSDIATNKSNISQNATDIIHIKEDNIQQDKKIKNLSDVQSEFSNTLNNHESAIHLLDDKNKENESDIEKNKQDIIATKEATGQNKQSIENLASTVSNNNLEIYKKIEASKTTVNDTGWQDITLESGITVSDSNGGYPSPQYRIITINNIRIIQIKGVLKGIKKNGDIKLGSINANLKTTHHYTQCAIDTKMINTRMYLNFKNELHFVTSSYQDSDLTNGDKRFVIDTQIIE
ncbi:tail fibers protein [Staphylococcus phage vB_SauP_phiAGO1.9]|uniref:Tail fibers protein n=2 Tax=Rosenblumvirus AGO13 TaxID=2732600 RepID=A0A2I7SBV0_9CAUD|nr:tail protein [Staphylococcus phage vB_SauP_phiAGO1.3]AUS03379.1 tail fibers protein [Staphylococcus phage vB_SauP_phiAGO1.3]AUS03394.1 tail fibers protein [Staphylococcus phage vB_SauP_phiAGO1.9]